MGSDLNVLQCMPLPSYTQDSLQMLWLATYLTGFPPAGLYALNWAHGLTLAGVASDLRNAFVEGTNNKVKMVKRTMYGRCSKKLLAAKLMYNPV